MNPPPTVRLRRVLLSSSMLLAACWSARTWRDGPPFDEAFPDATVLVRTPDPDGVLARLDRTQLPATDAHHERLLALVRERDTIDAAHLVLLAHAVARPAAHVTVQNGVVRSYGARGDGEGARVIEELLAEGLPKLGAVDRRWFGELVAVTQTDASLQQCADRCLPVVDDGSVGALREMLDGMAGSPATAPFLAGYLAPRGALDGPRGWLAFEHVPFDSDRLAVLRALLAREQPIDGERMVAVMRAFDFDGSREHAFALLAERVSPLRVEHAQASLATFSFDSSRTAACAALAGNDELQLRDEHLTAIAKQASFDSNRARIVAALAPRLDGPVDGDAALALLREFAFDSSRLAAVHTLAPRWQQLPAAQRVQLLDAFLFESSRADAATALMR
jgi:hypothetical protein